MIQVMSTNKIVYNGRTLIDLTGDTVTESTLLSGATAHNMKGEKITGNVVVKSEQSKNFEITSNGSYTVSPDSGKTLSRVNITAKLTDADTVDGFHVRVVSSGDTGVTGALTFIKGG